MIVSPLWGVNEVIPGFKRLEDHDSMVNEQDCGERLVSIVIPVYNEVENVDPLIQRTTTTLGALEYRTEIILVDDASTDGTADRVRNFPSRSAVPLRLLELDRRMGQHRALLQGFAASRGEWVISLDGDLQNPPESIPRLLKELEAGHDHVIGRRGRRRDPLHRRMLSWLLLQSAPFLTGIPRHDYGSMFRGYSRSLVDRILADAGAAPFVPALACRAARSFVEVSIPHHERVGGKSKYNWARLLGIAFNFAVGGREAPFHWLSLIGATTALGAICMGLVGALLTLGLGLQGSIYLLLAPVLFLLGLLAAAAGLIGVYVQRLYLRRSECPASVPSAATASESESADAGGCTRKPTRVSPRILFCGYREVGHGVLEHLLAIGAPVVAVATHPTAVEEEGLWPSVEELAVRSQIPLLLSGRVRSQAFFRALELLEIDMIVSAYYRRVLPARVLALAHRGAYNLHPSLLPAYRGRAPINWALLRGETRTGVTLHEMVEEPDAGPIVAQVSVAIAPEDDAGTLSRKLAQAAIRLFADTWPALERGDCQPRPQDESRAFRVGRRTPEDGRIDWRAPSEEIRNLVRAVAHPFPGAFWGDGDARVTIWRCALADSSVNSGLAPGTLVTTALGKGFCCGDGGVLVPLEAQFGRGPKLRGEALAEAITAWEIAHPLSAACSA